MRQGRRSAEGRNSEAAASEQPPHFQGDPGRHGSRERKEKRKVRERCEPETEKRETRPRNPCPSPLESVDEQRDARGEEREAQAVTAGEGEELKGEGAWR